MCLSSTISAGSRMHDIHILPVEMLSSIFEYLSVNERKIVKLVCKSWFEICDMPSLLNEEVISCHGCYELSDTYELLSRSQRSLLNLKFNRIEFTDDISFWIFNGLKIRSITFEDCQFGWGVLGLIIYFCKNLLHLAIRYISCAIPFPNFTSLPGNKVLQENLQSLEIVYNFTIHADDVINLLSTFPRLEVLKINLAVPCESVLAVINEYLIESSDRIRKLALQFKFEESILNEYDRSFRILTGMKSLTELCISTFSESQQDNLEKFLLSKRLKSLEYCQNSSRVPLESFLRQLLLTNSSLKNLKICSFDDFVVTTQLYEKLMTSNLKRCHFDFKGTISVQDVNSLGSCFSAEHGPSALPRLTVSISHNYSEENIVSFLQCFPNLHHLKIDNSYISPDILRTLFKHQKKLRSLIEHKCEGLQQLEKYVGIFKQAMNQLTDIEHLELGYSLTYLLLKSLSSEPVFVNLKYLKIELSDGVCPLYYEKWTPGLDVMNIAGAEPYLEALYVHASEYECRKLCFSYVCSELCAKLSRLKFIRWDVLETGNCCTVKNYEQFFSDCSSLRVVWHRQSTQITKIYFFDTLNKKVTPIPTNSDFFTFAEPSIGGFTVNWLRF